MVQTNLYGDYYQREYRWEKKHLTELVQDLAEKLLESHDPENDRSAVEQYGHYFLGSIIISEKGGQKFIIGGQQRLASLTLLLISIYNPLEGEEKGLLSDLIFSVKYGKRSFNLDVPERTACMDALFSGNMMEENLLAQSLHEGAYDYNPGFRKLIESTTLYFRPHTQFKKEDLDARQTLYGRLAERIWDQQQLQLIAG